MSEPRSDLPTHQVENQPPVRGDIDLLQSDPVLQSHLAAVDRVSVNSLARTLGQARWRQTAREAQRHPPELVLFDAAGRRLDEVRFHPAYHDLMTLGLQAGYAVAPWTGGSHLSHAAMVYLFSQVEPGICCPMTMTYAAAPVLNDVPVWRSRVTAPDYDPRILPIGQKRAATLGMAMTEKQGGSDVRANSTLAVPDGEGYRLTGHKWFCSAPMSDGFLTLAQAPGGLTCFLVPRWLEDGRNAIHLMRLKDKLGNRSNGSAEIEYQNAFAERIGDEGDGVRTIIRMVHHTRLDTAVAPAGLMRAALCHAHYWATHRRAFQRNLIDAPLMRAVLADLVLDWEGATALGMRVAAAFDDPNQAGFARISVALAKFLNNKLAPNFTYECMEVLGGMGYVEDTPLPMLYREAPLNSIWEGSGNVICLDILRTLAKDPIAANALQGELEAAKGADRHYDTALHDHQTRWPGLPAEDQARWFAERLAVLLTASVLIRQSPGAVADGYVATRVAGRHGRVTGAVAGLNHAAILERIGNDV
ncbi:acyl-CoA dehydrogenase [Actibacterium mucosum KCTC 23349]|uniref:Acyl-CoA dehydrogenase n=1 Tax=Actibacterium mucosum KCTC 23349 TaxID=1454373 RepID=A0A037ZJI1_9RHOB|nr:acyl-CoA dehydrogenase family protein [Actibacterium mucosum]KAJ56595.1 acyl-CoA dehydrogenase [Actibacterium mucosum KCTC 23349]